MERGLTWVARLGFAGGIVGSAPFFLFNVDGGQRAVMWTMWGGVSDKVYGEGTHFRVPGLMRPTKYNIRIKAHELKTSTGTKDIQTVTIHVRLLYRPSVDALPRIHQSLGPEFAERTLPSFGNEVLKAAVAQYNAEQLLTMRDKVSSQICDMVTRRAKGFDIILEDVSIVHLAYGKDFAKAIEDKQIAEQDAERQKFIVDLSEQERQATVIKAEGEAQAAQMISEALKEHGSGLIDVRRIDTARDIAKQLSRSGNVMYLPGGQNVLMQMSPPGSR